MEPVSRKEIQDPSNEEPPFDINGALNTKGFSEFLVQNPDAKSLDVNDPRLVKERFEVFTNKEEVKKQLGELFAKRIKEEVGLTLGADQLALVDKEIEKRAINNPNEIAELQSKLLGLREFPGQIKALEGRLSQMGNSAEFKDQIKAFEAQRVTLETAKDSLDIMGKVRLIKDSAKLLGNMPFFLISKTVERFFPSLEGYFMSGEKRQNISKLAGSVISRVEGVEEVKEQFGKVGKVTAVGLIESIKGKIEDRRSEIKRIGLLESQLDRLKSSFDKIRRDVIGSMAGISGLKEAIQTSVKKQLQSLTKNSKDANDAPSLQDLEKAKKLFGELRAKTENSETGIDPLGGIDEEKFIAVINNETELAIRLALDKALSKRLGNNTLKELESALGGILNIREVGYKIDDEARQALVDIIKNARESLSDKDKDATVKKLLLSRIIGRAEKNEY